MVNAGKHIDHLITHFLSGEASEKEKSQIELWLNESEANRKYFDQIKFIHEKASKTYPDIDFNVEKAWSNVKSQMKSMPKVDIKVRKLQWGWISAAASIIAIIAISTIISLSTQKRKISNPIIATNTIVSKDSTISQKLPDNTQVFLNRKSKLVYSPDYGKKNRVVTLTGEAYFTATHSKGEPLTVKADGTIIKDIGTEFNIKAYPDDDLIEVYVQSGSVVFYSETEAGVTLVNGEIGTYSKKTKQFSKQKSADTNILSYKTKSFIFINAKLSDVIKQLNNVYNTQLSLKNKELTDCTITVTFDNESIETIASIISETLDLKLSKTSDGYTLDGLRCDNP